MEFLRHHVYKLNDKFKVHNTDIARVVCVTSHLQVVTRLSSTLQSVTLIGALVIAI